MTSRLRQALAKAETLPAADQDSIAHRLLAEVEDERGWAARFAATRDDQWDAMVADVRRDVATWGGHSLDEVFLPAEPPR